MLLEILKDAEAVWRKVVKLATPLDSDKPVVIGTKPRLGDFEAYTDNETIYINIDEKQLRQNLESIILPIYAPSANILYNIPNNIPKTELLPNLSLDNFLFIHFHEQLHPWLCPNSKDDRKKISKALYESIRKNEPKLPKSQAMLKVNNSKNLIWDTVLNISFLHKTSDKDDILSNRISFVFSEDKRQIQLYPITKYPSGILPTLYMTSANNRKTDIPISLIGALYSTLSFNTSDIRERAFDLFLKDLEDKKLSREDAIKIIKEMYKGFVKEANEIELQKKGIRKEDFEKIASGIDNLTSPDYEKNQKYLISTLTTIFDSPSLRYDSLKGFIQVLSPYLSLSEKQGSPDPNTSGGRGGGYGEDKGEKKGKEEEKSQDEMDADSVSETLDDLLGELDEKEANDLMEEVANDTGNMGNGMGAGGPSASVRRKLSITAADEYYKKNADVIEIRNPSHEMFSFDIGNRERWKLVRSTTLTSLEVSKLNHQQIIAFQRKTGLPVLIEAGGGFFKLNEYILEKIPLKSYSFQKTGIEIPDNWVLFQDSSSSMTGGHYVGTGDKFDVLNRVKYGFLKGLYKVCQELGKDLKFGVVDFSDKTVYRGLESLVKIYEAKTHPIKEISLWPQCGGTCLNHEIFGKIEKDIKPGRAIYTLITDGKIFGDTNPLYRRIEKFSSQPDNSFVFIEVGPSTEFGKRLKKLSDKNPAVLYFHVPNIKAIKDKLSSVLIKYT